MDFFITNKTDLNLSNVPNELKLNIVSFNRSVLDKYEQDNKFKIDLAEGAGTLSGNGWTLQIDVGSEHVSTFLYTLAQIPDDEIAHFHSNNIFPRQLGAAAHRRWTQGVP